MTSLLDITRVFAASNANESRNSFIAGWNNTTDPKQFATFRTDLGTASLLAACLDSPSVD